MQLGSDMGEPALKVIAVDGACGRDDASPRVLVGDVDQPRLRLPDPDFDRLMQAAEPVPVPVLIAIALAVFALPDRARAQGSPSKFDFGTSASTQEVAAVAIAIAPDGKGLPAGKGDYATGKRVYETTCSALSMTLPSATVRCRSKRSAP